LSVILYIDNEKPAVGWSVAKPGSPIHRELAALFDTKLRGEQSVVSTRWTAVFMPEGLPQDWSNSAGR